MALVPVPFVTQSYQSASLPFSAQRAVNVFVERAPETTKTKSMALLRGTPGTIDFSTVRAGFPINGMHVMNNVLYVVSNENVYSVNELGTASLIGTIGSNTDDVLMADNGTQIMLVKSNYQGWIITSSTVTRITDSDFPGATSVDFLDGYFLITVPNSDSFYWSAINNGLSWSATDFASAEGNPDNLVRLFVFQRQIWLQGENTTEVWYNTGASPTPFSRIDGTFIERGLAAKFSTAEDDNRFFWLGNDGVVYVTNGYIPQRVSTHPIEAEIQNLGNFGDATGFFYTQQGHKFYCLTFPRGNRTLCYDIATELWHERSSWEIGRWRMNCGIYAYNKNLVGDYANGKIYELDLDTYTENGGIIQSIGIAPPIFEMGRRIFHSYLNIDMETGVGLTEGQGSDPQIMLDWSDDGGFTWSNEHWRTMGAIGAYFVRAVWRRLGFARGRIYRFTITDPVKRAIYASYIEVEPGEA